MINQVRSWLATLGVSLPRRRSDAWWTDVRDRNGAGLPAELQTRIARTEARLALIETQIAALSQAEAEAARRAPAESPLGRLVQVKGIAATGATVLLEEGLVWREFQNRRQIGGLVGFRPMPYQSGDQGRDQGIDRAGNSRLRAISLQLAWNWVRWQRSSALTQWFERRFGGRGSRARRIGIVAVARKLLIALWRYATTGELPAGAVLKV